MRGSQRHHQSIGRIEWDCLCQLVTTRCFMHPSAQGIFFFFSFFFFPGKSHPSRCWHVCNRLKRMQIEPCNQLTQINEYPGIGEHLNLINRASTGQRWGLISPGGSRGPKYLRWGPRATQTISPFSRPNFKLGIIDKKYSRHVQLQHRHNTYEQIWSKFLSLGEEIMIFESVKTGT